MTRTFSQPVALELPDIGRTAELVDAYADLPLGTTDASMIAQEVTDLRDHNFGTGGLGFRAAILTRLWARTP